MPGPVDRRLARLGIRPGDDRAPEEFRMVALLDRRVEGVHVEMGDQTHLR